jgi:Rrf2 family protein
MIDLAQHRGGALIPLKDLAARQEISEKYLESIIMVLSRARYVSGTRGKGGGYCLLRRPEECTVSDILKLTDGSLAPVACLGLAENTCPRAAGCKTLPMWTKLDGLIEGYLAGITVADLVNGTV